MFKLEIQKQQPVAKDDNVVALRPVTSTTGASENSEHVAPPQAPRLVKSDDPDKQIVYGEVYVPDVPDSQGDVASAEEIEQMAHGFIAKGLVKKIDVQHDGEESGAVVVESFIARKNDPDGFIEGAWVLGVHIPDTQLWESVKSGELNGFSLEGIGFKKDVNVSMTVPDAITGLTGLVKSDDGDEHQHTFTVHYGPEGEFIGGMTDVAPDGHYHLIKRGTATEEANGHTHRFSFVEGVLEAEILADD